MISPPHDRCIQTSPLSMLPLGQCRVRRWTRPHGERRLAHVVRQVAHATVFSRAFLFGVAVSLLVGCSSVSIPPTYTEDELKVICERHNGWWHPDELVGGFCEQKV